MKKCKSALLRHLWDNHGSEMLASLLLMVTAFTIGGGIMSLMLAAYGENSVFATWIAHAASAAMNGGAIM